VLLNHRLALLHGQASEGEHANLGSDVGPVTLDSLSLEGGAESLPHVVHAGADGDELIEPLLAESGVVENASSNSGTMLRRGRVVGANDDLDLREDAGGGILVRADEMHAASTLTVETHDLSEGLSDDHLEALGEEEAEAIGILVEAAGGETLVGSVEEGVKLVALANISDLLPLSLRGVDTCRVVSTGVEENARAGLSALEVGEHASDIEALGRLVEVAVLADVDASSLEDGVVVAPGRVANVEGGRPELGKEFSNDTESTSAGEGLHASDVFVTNERAVEAEEDTLGALTELGETVDREVLLVEGHVSDDGGLSGADDGEDERLAVVVTVCSNTEVDLVRVLVILEAGGEAKDGVDGGHRHVDELVVDSGESA